MSGASLVLVQFALNSPVLCSLLHKAKSPLIAAFNIHSYPGLHMQICLPGETEVFYVLTVLIVVVISSF